MMSQNALGKYTKSGPSQAISSPDQVQIDPENGYVYKSTHYPQQFRRRPCSPYLPSQTLPSPPSQSHTQSLVQNDYSRRNRAVFLQDGSIQMGKPDHSYQQQHQQKIQQKRHNISFQRNAGNVNNSGYIDPLRPHLQESKTEANYLTDVRIQKAAPTSVINQHINQTINRTSKSMTGPSATCSLSSDATIYTTDGSVALSSASTMMHPYSLNMKGSVQPSDIEQEFSDDIYTQLHAEDLLVRSPQAFSPPTNNAMFRINTKKATETSLSSTEGTDQSSDMSDEELYIRRVSVLYHELLGSEWAENHIGYEVSDSDTSNNFLSPSGRASPQYDISSIPGDRFANCSTETIRPSYDNPLCSDTALPAAHMPDKVHDPDNRGVHHRFRNTHAKDDADVSSHRINSSNGTTAITSLATATTTTTTNTKTNTTLVSKTEMVPTLEKPKLPRVLNFTPPDLADALIGTIHRLEDEGSLKQHKRWNTVKELAVTEVHYLRDILLLKAIFYDPLMDTEKTRILHQKDVNMIFGNIEQVIDSSRSLVEYLTVAVVYEAKRCHTFSMHSSSQQSDTKSPDIQGETSNTNYRSSAPPLCHGAIRPISHQDTSKSERISKRTGEPALRSSTWADVSIAQSFLLLAQRIEESYSKYCQNFEVANQRLIDIKKTAHSITGTVQTPNTVPSTFSAGYFPENSNSPQISNTKGKLRQSDNESVWGTESNAGVVTNSSSNGNNNNNNIINNNNSTITSSTISSNNTSYQSTHDDDDTYCVNAQQFIIDQAQQLSGKTTSWDLASLLIKPVQRILKYPLLLKNLVGLTPTGTSDRTQLEKALHSIESIADVINSVSSNGNSVLSGSTRISTATSTSIGPSSNDDGQNRLARELRRVLRRKPGTMSHMRSKSTTESGGKDRTRSVMKMKRKDKDTLSLNTLSLDSAVIQAEASIDQHEGQISDLIHSLRRWEKMLGSSLSAQVLISSRWKDVYAASNAKSSRAQCGKDCADGKSSDDSQQSDRIGRGQTVSKTCSNDSLHHSRTELDRARAGGEPFTALRSSKSYSALRSASSGTTHNCSTLNEPSRRRWALQSKHSEAFSLRSINTETGITDTSTSFKDTNERYSCWHIEKYERVRQWYSTLEDIYKSVYPMYVCNPLHSKVYPVLNSLLQIYSDGPRHVILEYTKLYANANASSGGSSGGSDGVQSRLSNLEHALSTELPKLFKYEQEVVQLLMRQLIAIENNFYKHALAKLEHTGNVLGIDLSSVQYIVSTSVSDIVPLNRSLPARWCNGIINEYMESSSQSTKASADGIEASSTELLNKLQLAVYVLTAEANELVPQYVIKSRHSHRTSTASIDNGGRSTSSFSSPRGSFGASIGLVMSDESDKSVHASILPSSRSGQGSKKWQNNDYHSTFPSNTISAMSGLNVRLRHTRKKSSGLVDMLSHLKPGSHGRESSKNAQFQTTRQKNMETLKTRRQTGLAIDIIPTDRLNNNNNNNSYYGSNRPTSPPSEAGLRSPRIPLIPRIPPSVEARGDTDKWLDASSKYEPLPLVDSIRFSRGFIDNTFKKLSSKNRLSTSISDDNDTSDDSSDGAVCNNSNLANDIRK